MKNKQTLIETIKSKKKTTSVLRGTIKEQQVSLMRKVSSELVDNKIFHRYTERDYRIEIPIGDSQEAIIQLSGGNFRVSFPNVIYDLNSITQIMVFRILGKFDNELTDIQLDIRGEVMNQRWQEEMELDRVVAEEIFEELKSKGVLEVNGRTYGLTTGQKGRYNFTTPSGEIKSLFKSDIVSRLVNEASIVAKELVKE